MGPLRLIDQAAGIEPLPGLQAKVWTHPPEHMPRSAAAGIPAWIAAAYSKRVRIKAGVADTFLTKLLFPV